MFSTILIIALGGLVAAFAGLGTRFLVGRDRLTTEAGKGKFLAAALVAAVLLGYIGYVSLAGSFKLKLVAAAVMVLATLLGAFATQNKERNSAVKMIYAVAAVLAVGMGFLVFSGGGHGTAPLKHAKTDLSDQGSLQRGAAAYRDYCFSCHGLSMVRFNQLAKIGLSEDAIKQFMLANKDAKVGDMMTVSMKAADAKKWFGQTPPDLSLMTSAKGEDYVYSYLNGFYKDDTRPTGWNNLYLPNAAMPHVLWEEQGTVTKGDKLDAHGVPELSKAVGGKRNDGQYQELTQDITNFLYWAAEPDRSTRHYIGIAVMLFLFVLAFLARALSKNYWKDIK